MKKKEPTWRERCRRLLKALFNHRTAHWTSENEAAVVEASERLAKKSLPP